MNTQQGSSTGLNTVNYVIFLNISDSAVSACEELPGSQIQSDRSSPPALLRDGEKLLNSMLNHPAAEGRVRARLCLPCGGSRAIWWLWEITPLIPVGQAARWVVVWGHCPQPVRNPLRWGVQHRSVVSNTHCPESSSSEMCRCPCSPSPLPLTQNCKYFRF